MPPVSTVVRVGARRASVATTDTYSSAFEPPTDHDEPMSAEELRTPAYTESPGYSQDSYESLAEDSAASLVPVPTVMSIGVQAQAAESDAGQVDEDLVPPSESGEYTEEFEQEEEVSDAFHVEHDMIVQSVSDVSTSPQRVEWGGGDVYPPLPPTPGDAVTVSSQPSPVRSSPAAMSGLINRTATGLASPNMSPIGDQLVQSGGDTAGLVPASSSVPVSASGDDVDENTPSPTHDDVSDTLVDTSPDDSAVIAPMCMDDAVSSAHLPQGVSITAHVDIDVPTEPVVTAPAALSTQPLVPLAVTTALPVPLPVDFDVPLTYSAHSSVVLNGLDVSPTASARSMAVSDAGTDSDEPPASPLIMLTLNTGPGQAWPPSTEIVSLSPSTGRGGKGVFMH